MTIPDTRKELTGRLLDSYRRYFDIDTFDNPEEKEIPLAAQCRFYVHSEKYVLVKAAKLWETDCNEYVYVFTMPELTEERYEACRDYAYQEGMKLVQPGPGHMYSYITAVFVCDSCTPEAKKALRRCRIYKSFHFSLHGWMDFHTALLVREEGQAFTNRSGRANAKFMKKLMSAR